MYDWRKAFTEDEIKDWIRFGCDGREPTVERLNIIAAATPNQEYKIKTNELQRKLLECFPDEEAYQQAYHQIHYERNLVRSYGDDEMILSLIKKYEIVPMDLIEFVERRENEIRSLEFSYFDDGSNPWYEMPEELQELYDYEDKMLEEQLLKTLGA